jgi:hypothetical protein
MSTATDPPPRGWYNDPTTPDLDRWWDGTAWTEYTHRNNTVRYTMFGSTYARAWWIGPNRAAGRSLLLSRIAFLAYIVSLVVTIALDQGDKLSLGIAIGFAVVTIVCVLMTGAFMTALLLGALRVA